MKEITTTNGLTHIHNMVDEISNDILKPTWELILEEPHNGRDRFLIYFVIHSHIMDSFWYCYGYIGNVYDDPILMTYRVINNHKGYSQFRVSSFDVLESYLLSDDQIISAAAKQGFQITKL